MWPFSRKETSCELPEHVKKARVVIEFLRWHMLLPNLVVDDQDERSEAVYARMRSNMSDELIILAEGIDDDIFPVAETLGALIDHLMSHIDSPHYHKPQPYKGVGRTEYIAATLLRRQYQLFDVSMEHVHEAVLPFVTALHLEYYATSEAMFDEERDQFNHQVQSLLNAYESKITSLHDRMATLLGFSK